MVSACVDGAAINLGVHRGLVALLQEDMPWLVAIHCFNHRLELAAKYAFAKIYMDDVSSLLMVKCIMCKKSPERLREFKELADVLEEGVKKPEKSS